ncbi:TetR family transcriptional regulator [Paenibacillus sp. FSL H7-0326]|uniref:TetR/AcrR family transcriptional regulator n=1 Tax=Paenibacillus sp. FSL H7-0326 TaxID=1921144 RepID=UPI00096D7969|nr:TetR/AcrR family transcriptional regulator [Paenibacillus sp. FSL H7-0326]OMC64438.1 TetR family transcriptional regulator [Paenibacillus sp. FSL H7-0326]
MNDKIEDRSDGLEPRDNKVRFVRADAKRNINALLQSAMTVFESSGVDAPVREIAQKAGVGVGTVYRHFPQRSDLIEAVFRQEIDACAYAAGDLASKYEPVEALERWMQRYLDFIATKRGLAAALHSNDPAYETLPVCFVKELSPALKSLLETATAAGEVRADVEPDELLWAVASLCTAVHDGDTVHAQHIVALLVDGLRYRANR